MSRIHYLSSDGRVDKVDLHPIDIRTKLPDGTRHRERVKSTHALKTEARAQGEARERHLIRYGLEPARAVETPMAPAAEASPTLAEFAARFIADAIAERQKPSTVHAKRSILKNHLLPLLGELPLDAIGAPEVQALKARLAERAVKTVNNTLTVLSALLKKGVELGVLERAPSRIRLLRVPKLAAARFYDFAEYGRLVAAAEAIGPEAHLVVLLGGDAGLRCGEVMGLHRSDLDLERRRLVVRRSDWYGTLSTPKGNAERTVPLTARLAAALKSYRHLRGPRVLYTRAGHPLRHKDVQALVRQACRKAEVEYLGVHVLRHTCGSHLSIRGAAPRAIQAILGHVELSTTQRYMGLREETLEAAIQLLEAPSSGERVGRRGGDPA